MTLSQKLRVLGTTLTLGLAITAPARAVSGFTDIYAPSNWTLQGTGSSVDTSSAPTSITLNNDGTGIVVDYFVTAGGDGTVSFNYSTIITDNEDDFDFYLNGGITGITVSQNSSSGFFSTTVSENDDFGFSLDDDSNDSTSSVTITNFSAPDAATPVPFDLSPNLGILMVFGVVGGNWAKKKLSSRK